MVTIEKITSDLFPLLYESFLHSDDPLSNEQDWRHVFDYPWDIGEGHCGYAMLDGDELVGMLGMVFSERQISGAAQRFCNLHTWWVREDYRGHSLRLLKPLLDLQGYTITHFTPCDTIRGLTKRLGFRQLSSQLRILLPDRRNADSTADAELTFELDDITPAVTDDDLRILNDHQPYGCGHLLIREGSRHSYLLYTHVVRHRLPYCHIHYFSDRELYLKHESAVRAALLDRYASSYVALDTRLVEDVRFPRSFNFWAPAHAVYKPNGLREDQVDNLYSDIVFLKLTALPDITHQLGQIMRRAWPFANRRSIA